MLSFRNSMSVSTQQKKMINFLKYNEDKKYASCFELYYRIDKAYNGWYDLNN